MSDERGLSRDPTPDDEKTQGTSPVSVMLTGLFIGVAVVLTVGGIGFVLGRNWGC